MARILLDAGYPPHTISTDLNTFNLEGPVFSLVTTMSKMWSLGIDLPEVIAMATTNTAQQLRRSDTLGAIAVGRAAHLSVLQIVDEPVRLSDGYRGINVERSLEPVGCTVDGRWYDADRFVSPRTAEMAAA